MVISLCNVVHSIVFPLMFVFTVKRWLCKWNMVMQWKPIVRKCIRRTFTFVNCIFECVCFSQWNNCSYHYIVIPFIVRKIIFYCKCVTLRQHSESW
jgi:hypothetical protein